MAAGMPNLSEEQKNRLAQRLSMMSHDRGDVGQGLPRTMRALALGEGSDAGAARLEALVDALVFERVIVPIDVEPDPRVTGVHAGEVGTTRLTLCGPRPRPGTHSPSTRRPRPCLLTAPVIDRWPWTSARLDSPP